MKIEVINYKKTRKEAQRYIAKKLPLASRVAQFNTFIENMHIEYIEFKVIQYEISTKKRGLLRTNDIDKENINIIVNTSDGRSESIHEIPQTSKKYVPKTCIKQNSINEDELSERVKEEIIKYLKDSTKYRKLIEKNICSIDLLNIKSIYKACWIADFKGRKIVIDIE